MTTHSFHDIQSNPCCAYEYLTFKHCINVGRIIILQRCVNEVHVSYRGIMTALTKY